MSGMILHVGSRRFIISIFLFQLLMIVSVIFNYPILRILSGFFYLTTIPGILILLLLGIKDIKKYLLIVPFSIVFVLVVGLIINNFSTLVGIKEPISFFPMILIFFLSTVMMTIVLYVKQSYVKQEFFDVVLQCKKCTALDKLIIILSVIPVTLTIFGSYLLNEYNSNILIHVLLFLLCGLIALVYICKSKINTSLFPLIIYSIGLSLLLSWALKSDFIIMGADTDWEYYLYGETLKNSIWKPYTAFTVDACLSISLLPAIYQIFLNVNDHILYKVLFALLYSVSPLIVYSISKKYLSEYYAFFATMIFISYYQFFTTNNRNNVALLFCIAFIFVLFDQKNKTNVDIFLLIALFLGSVLSHYTTSLLFWMVLAVLWAIICIIYNFEFYLNRCLFGWNGDVKFGDYNPYRSGFQLILISLLFSVLYFWYAIAMEAPFHQLVAFIGSTSGKLSTFLDSDASISGGKTLNYALGSCIDESFAHFVEYSSSWSIILFICLGVFFALLLISNHYLSVKKVPLSISLKKYGLLSIDVPFIILSTIAVVLIGVSFLFPYVSSGYGFLRVYSQFLVILCPFFIIGVVLFFYILTTKIRNLLDYMPWLKNTFLASFDIKKSMKYADIVILLLVILYLISTTGFIYQLNGINKSIIFNTGGDQYNDIIIKEGELVGASWLMDYGDDHKCIYSDLYGRFRVIIGGGFNPGYEHINNRKLQSGSNIVDHYIFMRCYNVVEHKILTGSSERVDLKEVRAIMTSDNIYTNGECKILLP